MWLEWEKRNWWLFRSGGDIGGLAYNFNQRFISRIIHHWLFDSAPFLVGYVHKETDNNPLAYVVSMTKTDPPLKHGRKNPWKSCDTSLIFTSDLSEKSKHSSKEHSRIGEVSSGFSSLQRFD